MAPFKCPSQQLLGKNTPLNIHNKQTHTYTWIPQVCKICAFLPKKPYQKAEILHIWKM